MRVAFSGTHHVGKSTLIERLAVSLPGHDLVDEPYRLLEDEGHLFSHPPTQEDFEVQLERSLAEIEASGPDLLLDRSPLDFVAYLLAEGHDPGTWLDRAARDMARLDLVVFVPIETPDRIVLPLGEDRGQRAAVDAELARLLFEEDLAPKVLTVHGDVGARVQQVLDHLPTSGA